MSRITRIARSLCADSPDREQLFDDYIKMITFDGLREVNPKYVEHLRKRFETMPIPDLLQGFEDRKRVDWEKKQWEMDNIVRTQVEERKKLNLRTAREEYERTDDTYERAVCSDKNPLFEKKGMPAFDDELAGHDKELRGYYSVHVGSGWLPIMIRDQYCEGKKAYVYDINTEPAYNTKKPFYVMDDYHIMDRTVTPDSNILFSKYPVIPAKLIRLRTVIPVSRIEPAPDLY